MKPVPVAEAPKDRQHRLVLPDPHPPCQLERSCDTLARMTTTSSLIRLPASTTYTVEQALQSALQEDLADAIVIGYDQEGRLFIRSSRMTCAQALFLTTKAARWAESGGDP